MKTWIFPLLLWLSLSLPHASAGEFGPSCSTIILEKDPKLAQSLIDAAAFETTEVRYLQRGSRVVVLMAAPIDNEPAQELVEKAAAQATFLGEQGAFPRGVGYTLARTFPALADPKAAKSTPHITDEEIETAFAGVLAGIADVRPELAKWIEAHAGASKDEEFEIKLVSRNRAIIISGSFDLASLKKFQSSLENLEESLRALANSHHQIKIALQKGHRPGLREQLLSIYFETRINHLMIDQYYAIPGLIRDTAPLQLIAYPNLSPSWGIVALSSSLATIITRAVMEFWIDPARFGISVKSSLIPNRGRTMTRNLLRALKDYPDENVMVNYVALGHVPDLIQRLTKAGFTEVAGPQ
jgi:hypothetical protein